MTQALQNGFQLTSEGKTLILKKKPTKICFDKKMAKKSGIGYLLTTEFCKSANDASILDPKKRNPEGKAYIQPEGTAVKKQENKTKKNTTRKVHANKPHAKLVHIGEDRMRATARHLNYSINETL